VATALVAAIALGGLSNMMRSNRQPRVELVNGPGAVGTSGYIERTGEYVTRTLPGLPDLRLPASGTEDRLLRHIETPSTAGGTWFVFDRLRFEPDSARLTADSREQLSNTAAILRAYPYVRVKIGGYTDNSGNPADNMRLSQVRANAVAAELTMLGVDRARIEAEGFGSQHPIASNSTESGRAQNRRVAIRVISR
jgi:K(+)-stimulated pyrophosphate-energized sodium pump